MPLPKSLPPDDRRGGFSGIETWVFDLDNTLYPHHLNLWQQVDVRIRDYIVKFLDVTHDEAFRLQKDYYRRYGTTLRGLMVEHGMKPDDFLDFVHQIDHTPIEPNPALGSALKELAGRKLILTNGTRPHAEAVMRRLEVHEHFEDVFDIAAAGYVPKPEISAYRAMLARHGIDPTRAAMLDDMPRNLAPAAELGMTTIWVKTDVDWAQPEAETGFIHHTAENLADWLHEISGDDSKP